MWVHPIPISDPEVGPLDNLSNMLGNCVVFFINRFHLITMNALVLNNLFGCNKCTFNKIQGKHFCTKIIISGDMTVLVHVCEEQI